MATIRAFRAVRPAPQHAGDIADLPYDVMNSMEAREMVKDRPISFLRIDRPELNYPAGHDMYSYEVYHTARDVYNEMKGAGQLVQDAKPMYYIYQQTMGGKTQTGLVAAASIDDYANDVIKKHELTRKEKEQDRVRHIDAMNANTGPIFLTYRERADIPAILQEWAAKHKPMYDFVMSPLGVGDVAHRAWAIDCDETIAKITKAFAGIDSLYIADGHHRNASAYRVSMLRRAQYPGAGADSPINYYLTVIFPSNELNILDYNRVVKDLNGLSPEDFLKKLGGKFVVEKAGSAYRPERRNMFGMYLAGGWHKLTANPECAPKGDPVQGLDVSILQNEVLTPILGIKDVRADPRIDFVGGLRGLGELESRVDSGNMAVAFSMFPTSMDELMDISDAGMLMPPKSTWFEPKLLSGLFIHELC